MALHRYRFLRTEHEQGAEIQVAHSVILHVHIGDKYRERFPKPTRAPRTLTVTSILPPSNDNSGTAQIGGSTERSWSTDYGPIKVKGSTTIMAYTLHSHWEKV